MKEKSNGTVELVGKDRSPVKVCDVINGRSKVKQVIRDDCIEFVFRYSLFRKEIKRYDKKTFEEIERTPIFKNLNSSENNVK